MTDQTTGKVAQLTPEEWKQLVLLNFAQIQNHLQTQVPGTLEGGASGLTPERLAAIDEHLARGRSFMRAWSLAKMPVEARSQAVPAEAPVHAVAQTNGAAEPKRKGGWPRGKKRTPKQPEAA